MPPIRFVYFDLDDTLLDHRHAERAALADVYAAHRFPRHSIDEVRAIYHEFNLDVWRRYALGALTQEQAAIAETFPVGRTSDRASAGAGRGRGP